MKTTVEIEIFNSDATGDDRFLYPNFTDDVMNFNDIPTWDRENFTEEQNKFISTWLAENMNVVSERLNEQYERDIKSH